MLANNNKREFETYINESIKYLELLMLNSKSVKPYLIKTNQRKNFNYER